MSQNSIVQKRSRFFIGMATLGLIAVFFGFGKTFLLPMADGSFHAPPAVHLHGAFAFAWVLLFFTQTLLIYYDKFKIHQILGISGLFVAAGVFITMIPVAVFAVNRDLNNGLGESAYSTIVGVLSSGVLFFLLVLTGILNRHRPAAHKRFMLLATIVVLWPAWFRLRHYFPGIPKPELWFGLVLSDSLILIAWIWDKLRNGNIHPILLYGGLFIIIEQSLELWGFDRPAWRILAKDLYEFFTV